MMSLEVIMGNGDIEKIEEIHRRRAQEYAEIYKSIVPLWGRENYEFLKPYFERIDKEHGFYLTWQDGIRSVTIEKGEEYCLPSLIENYFTIACSTPDMPLDPCVRFIMDDERGIVVPTYFQNDFMYYRAHVIEENKCDNTTLLLADKGLHNGLEFMRDMHILSELMEIYPSWEENTCNDRHWY